MHSKLQHVCRCCTDMELVTQEAVFQGTSMGYKLAAEPNMQQPRRLSAKKRNRVDRSSDTACPSGTFQWPKASGYCWSKRETFGAIQGPGNNVFAASNVLVDSNTDTLTLNMVKKGSRTSCAEVLLDRSLGYGDYVWQTVTDPDEVSPELKALVGA